MAFLDFTRTRNYRNVMAKVYGIGASVVLIGALFKINHYPGADIALIVGLGTEAIVFFLSSFEPPHVDPDWSLVYPELSGMYHTVEGDNGSLNNSQKTSTQKLDEMFKSANIEQDTINRLGAGLEKLSDTTSKISDMADASAASQEFTTKLKTAAESAGSFGNAIESNVQAAGNYSQKMNSVNQSANVLSNAYVQAADAIKSNMDSTEEFAGSVKQATQSAQIMADSYKKSSEILTKSVEALDFTAIEGDAYNAQLRKIAENLAALNAIYEIQLKDTNEAVESSSKMKNTLNHLYESLDKSAQFNADFALQLETLTKRMSTLNKVYGNMLTAMNVQ
ncbi:MAG: gliding motility protein GldL [Bacteroidales bacterium]|nr:gliding motility protein GldL [Bacteroidales bacterium]